MSLVFCNVFCFQIITEEVEEEGITMGVEVEGVVFPVDWTSTPSWEASEDLLEAVEIEEVMAAEEVSIRHRPTVA